MEGSDGEIMSPLPAPRPRVFPVSGISSTPRCGHTLTALAGPDGDLQGARLVLFGECDGQIVYISRAVMAVAMCSGQDTVLPWPLGPGVCGHPQLPDARSACCLLFEATRHPANTTLIRADALQVVRRRWRAPRSPGTMARQPHRARAPAQVKHLQRHSTRGCCSDMHSLTPAGWELAV